MKTVVSSPRLHEIDGIRGWAALVVVLFHLTQEVFGALFPVYRSSLLACLFDGPLAVCVFFVLSGDALSSGFLRTRNLRGLARLTTKRYFRLAGPVFFTCALVWVLMKSHLVWNLDAAPVVHREDWLGQFLTFRPSIRGMIRYGLFSAFDAQAGTQNSYNPFLWPMPIELNGSFFIFGFLYVLAFLRPSALRAVTLITAYLLGLDAWYALFFAGLGFAMLRERGFFKRVRTLLPLWGWFACALSVFLANYFVQLRLKSHEVAMFISIAIVFVLYSSVHSVAFFSSRVSRYMGKISFPLYLSHFAVIVTWTSWLITILPHRHQTLLLRDSYFVVASSVILAIVIADLIARLEQRYLRTLDSLVGLLFTREATPESNLKTTSAV
jgi:peptidoglycan/LPS O-acetylase OafA/YrhL